MNSWRKSSCIVLLLALCSGCVRVETLVKLNGDGSGKLFIRYLVNESLDLQDGLEAKAKSLASKLGQGVTYVESIKIPSKQGWKGFRTEYKFTDVRKLEIGDIFSENSVVESDEEKNQNSVEIFPEMKDGVWRFKYKQGTSNELVAFLETPKVEGPNDEDPFAAAGVELETAPPAPAAGLGQAFAISMMKPMLKGARLSMLVQVEGDIVETNAPSRPTKSANSVHLIDLDLGKFAESKQFDKAVMGSWSLDRLVKEKVQGVAAPKGGEEILVRFK